MRKPLRLLGIGCAVLLGLLALGYLGLQAYLGSGAARQLAAGKISAKLGGEVAVKELCSGAGSTTVVVELAGGQPEPLLTGSIRVDATPIGLATGAAIHTVDVTDAVMTLHLDANNNLKSKFPKPPKGGGGGKLPDIRVSGATVHILQDGKPPFSASGVNVTLADRGDKLAITGDAADAAYGNWKVAGEWGTDGKAGHVHADTAAPVALTPEKLKAIPFIPNDTWETVELTGDSPIQVKIACDAGDKWSWHVECQPTGATLKVNPVGNLVVTNTSGQIVVDGTKVTLKGVRGDTADGEVRLDSAMDFGPSPYRLHFDVAAKGLDIKKVPAKWGLTRYGLDAGKLEGQGSVNLLLAGGKVKNGGSEGKATLKGKLGGGDIELDVQPELAGDELRFTQPAPKTSLIPLAFALATMLQAPPAPAAQPPAKPEEVQYVRANLKLKDVDLAELLTRAKVDAGVKIGGKVTLEVAAEIPTSNTGSVRLYRATGKVTVPALQVEGLTLNGVTADAELRDGVLTLRRLSAAFPAQPDGKPSGFLGTARFGIDPRTELSADLKLDAIPLDQVFAAIPGLAGKAAGNLSGTFDLKIPGDKLSDASAYVANGNLTSTSLTAFGQKAEKLAVLLALKNGVANLTRASADIYGGTIAGAAAVPVAGDKGGDYKVTFQNVDAAALTRAIPDSPVKLDGRFGGTLTGVLPPVAHFDASKLVGNLDLDAPKLIVQGVPTTKLKGTLGYKPGAIRYDLKGDAFGGTFDVDGAYPLGTPPKDAPKKDAAPRAMAAPRQWKTSLALLQPPMVDGKPAGGTVRVSNVQLDRLAAGLRIEALEPLRGVLNLNVNYTFDDESRPVGTGRVEVRGLGWGDEAEGSTLSAPIQLTRDGVNLPTLSGQFAGGTLRGRVEYGFAATRRRYGTLTLDNADAAELLAPLGFTDVEGRVSATLRSRLGREVRGGGTVVASRAKLGGVEVADLRVPLTWTVSPGGGGQLVVRDAAGTVASGRVIGRADITYRDTARVESRVEFVDVNIAALAKGFGTNSYGVGRTTGRIDLNGNDVRALKDLGGTLTASFGETSVQELPILGNVGSAFTSAQALTRFDRGEMVARLGGGVIRVERLSLASSSAKLFAEGTVGLSGRLDLDVVYNTGNVGPNVPLLRLVARNIPAIGPIPVGLIVRVSEALSNRVIRITVGGTTRRPTYQANAARLLTENAVRFFVTQYAPGNLTELGK